MGEKDGKVEVKRLADDKVKLYNLTNNHVTVEEICNGVTSGLTVTDDGDLACAVGSKLHIRNKYGDVKYRQNVV